MKVYKQMKMYNDPGLILFYINSKHTSKCKPPNHILVIRFSAMGDVAMTVPVIKNVTGTKSSSSDHQLYPMHFFSHCLKVGKMSFSSCIFKRTTQRHSGIYRLFKELKQHTHLMR